MMDFIRRQLGISYEDIQTAPIPDLIGSTAHPGSQPQVEAHPQAVAIEAGEVTEITGQPETVMEAEAEAQPEAVVEEEIEAQPEDVSGPENAEASAPEEMPEEEDEETDGIRFY